MDFFYIGDVRYSASIESIRAHSLALGDQYMAESSPSNSPNQSRRQSNDNGFVSSVSPISPVLPTTNNNNTHSILSHLLRKDDQEREPLLKRHSSKDYQAASGTGTAIDNHMHDPELGNQTITNQQQQYHFSDHTGALTATAAATATENDYHIHKNKNKTKEFPSFRPTWSQFRNPKNWVKCFTQPIQYIPAVILGLLLNLLDAISYGMITFPLNNPIFASFGPDGISMFFVR